MMGFTVGEARRLGMGVDMTLGSGWCFGGPTVSDQDANASVVVKTYDCGCRRKGSRRNLTATPLRRWWHFGPDGKIVDLTDKIGAMAQSIGRRRPEPGRVYAISQKPSGQKVKRAAPGGEGWMLNPVYPQAVRD